MSTTEVETEIETDAETEKGVDTKSDGSIVPEKYRDRYRGDGDWLKKFINGQIVSTVMKEVTTKAEDGTETTETVPTKKTSMDLDKLFDLASINSINAREKYEDQVERKNAPGRLRMTIGNMLRAAARHRHGLYNLEGEWVEADADFLGDAPKTHNQDGSKIVVEKPKEESAESEDA